MSSTNQTTIYKVEEEKEILTSEFGFCSVLNFKGKNKKSEEMKIFVLSLKSNKIKLPKFLFFKFFDELDETFIIYTRYIIPFSNDHTLGEKINLHAPCDGNYYIYEQEKRSFFWYLILV